MSLAEKWNEFIATADGKLTPIERHIAYSAFYAGAQAALKETGDGTYFEIQAEIDHFRSHK